MAKKRKQPQLPKQEKETISLGDQLNSVLLQQLKDKKKQLAAGEEKRKEEEVARKKEEARQREKNKSFEELFNESSLSWKQFK
jgi:Protein of unknown function (DUF3886)